MRKLDRTNECPHSENLKRTLWCKPVDDDRRADVALHLMIETCTRCRAVIDEKNTIYEEMYLEKGREVLFDYIKDINEENPISDDLIWETVDEVQNEAQERLLDRVFGPREIKEPREPLSDFSFLRECPDDEDVWEAAADAFGLVASFIGEGGEERLFNFLKEDNEGVYSDDELWDIVRHQRERYKNAGLLREV